MKAKPEAFAAIQAAKNYRIWGEWATDRFLEKFKVPRLMFNIARNVERHRK